MPATTKKIVISPSLISSWTVNRAIRRARAEVERRQHPVVVWLRQRRVRSDERDERGHHEGRCRPPPPGERIAERAERRQDESTRGQHHAHIVGHFGPGGWRPITSRDACDPQAPGSRSGRGRRGRRGARRPGARCRRLGHERPDGHAHAAEEEESERCEPRAAKRARVELLVGPWHHRVVRHRKSG